MLTVHHLNNSRSQRVLWMLEELGVPYQIERYERDPKTMLAPASLQKVHPLGKSPVVTDGKATLAESGAILEYLVEKYGEGHFAPERGTPSFLRYRYWLHYAEGSLATPLLLALVFDQIERKSPLIVRPVAKGIAAKVRHLLVTPNLKRHLDYLEAELEEHGPWFAGRSFSAADVQLSFPIEAAAARGLLGEDRPRLRDWLRRIHERPAYQRALDKGGPFDLTTA
ncbi:glutathione S-transferase [Hydrogenophaga sp.]|uniref:glutathione S-transferase family protein n=1 Tax=Hydrogenophaga sp. TaxID=1904254 RepID=UPI00262299BC|nr:glutathione S-transferase [Hydrogenophaga sp.]MCW5655404.1 glutathione S-transferase [Hydrogenophaga sp.]